jgi:hypothetical protein
LPLIPMVRAFFDTYCFSWLSPTPQKAGQAHFF